MTPAASPLPNWATWCAGVVIALVFVACGVPTEDRASTAGPKRVPFALLEDEPVRPPATVPPPAATVVRIYLLDPSGERLVAVDRSADEEAEVSLDEVVDVLLLGPTRPESNAGIRSAVGRTTVVDVGLAGGVANVDLNEEFAAIDGGTQRLALGQIVYTLTSRPGVGRVSFTLAGQPVEIPRGDGTLTSGSVSRDSYRELAPA